MPVQYIVQIDDGSSITEEDFGTDVPTTIELDGNMGYYLRVKRIINTSVIDYSNWALVFTLNPITLTASAVNNQYINLTWDTGCTTSFVVYRISQRTGQYFPIASFNDATDEFDDYDAPYGVVVYYYIQPITSNGIEANPSNIASASLVSGALFLMGRSTTYNGVQFGLETVIGTAVAAPKRLQFLGIDFSPQLAKRTVKYPGTRTATGTQRGKQHTEGQYSGVLDFVGFNYIASSIWSTVTPTSAGTLDFVRLWTISGLDVRAPKSYTIEQGTTSLGAEKRAGCIFTSCKIKFTEEEATVEGGIFGRETTRGITVTTASLAHIASDPIDPYAIGVYYSTDGSAFTRLTTVLDGEFDLGEWWRPEFHVNDAVTSHDDYIHLAANGMGASFNFSEGSEVTTMITAMKAGTKLWIRLYALGSLIEGAVYKAIRITMPVYVMSEDPQDDNDAWANTIMFEAAHDSTNMLEITTTCASNAATLGV